MTAGSYDAVVDNDEVQRTLCHRFLDAVERNDLISVAECFAPDAQLWFNVTGEVRTVDETVERLRQGATLHRRRTYDDRLIDTFDDGFLARFTVRVVRHDGSANALWAALVAQTRNGLITHLWEYLDSSRFSGQVRT